MKSKQLTKKTTHKNNYLAQSSNRSSALLLIMLLIFTSTSSYNLLATQTDDSFFDKSNLTIHAPLYTNTTTPTIQETTTTYPNHPVATVPESKERIRLQLLKDAQEIMTNHFSLKQLVINSKDKTHLVRQKIEVFKENLDVLSKDQLVLLKNAITQIKYNNATNADYLKQMRTYNEKIKIARDNKDRTTLLNLYNEILQLQQEAKDSLIAYNYLLDTILAIKQ